MDLREQIDAYIEKYKFEIVSRTCDFVKIPSVSTSDDSGRPYGLECARALDFWGIETLWWMNCFRHLYITHHNSITQTPFHLFLH